MAFPTTPVVENFTAANGTDLDTLAGWGHYGPAGLNNGDDPQIRDNAASTFDANGPYVGAHRDGATVGPDSEAYITITAAADYFGLGVRVTDPLTTTDDGYWLSWSGTNLSVQRSDNGTATQLGAAVTAAQTVGTKGGIEVIGSTIKLYTFSVVTSTWSEQASRTDSTYTAAGFLALDIYNPDNTARLDDFGGGTIAPTGGINGSGSPTLPAITASGAGTVAIQGSGSPTLGALTATGAGTVAVTGTGSPALPALTASGAGTVAVTGSGSPVLPALNGSGTGTLAQGITGSGSATLPALTGSGAGTVSGIVGTGSPTLLILTATGTGTVAAGTLPDVDIQAAFTVRRAAGDANHISDGDEIVVALSLVRADDGSRIAPQSAHVMFLRFGASGQEHFDGTSWVVSAGASATLLPLANDPADSMSRRASFDTTGWGACHVHVIGRAVAFDTAFADPAHLQLTGPHRPHRDESTDWIGFPS